MALRMIQLRLSDQDLDVLKRRQQQLLKEDMTPRPAPASRSRNSKSLTAQQVEQVRQALLNAFK
jgi:hypothetical protein